ncbi:MAG: hypothetical protein ACYS8I_09520 [Planctomycetota bacterium]
MRNMLVVIVCLCFLPVAGCDSLRFAPTEAQKQNAWLHNRTTAATAEQARAEDASGKLQALSGLSELQSRAFVSYCGLPKEFPPAETAEEILLESNFELAGTALAESADRPDVWDLADSGFELAIGISALLGGMYGTRAVRFLKEARAKSKALQEIIAGNELFKKEHKENVVDFKKAHQSQSPQTRQIVTQLKG